MLPVYWVEKQTFQQVSTNKGKGKDWAMGNTFNAQKYGRPRVHHVEGDISLIFFNELAFLSLFLVPDLC